MLSVITRCRTLEKTRASLRIIVLMDLPPKNLCALKLQ